MAVLAGIVGRLSTPAPVFEDGEEGDALVLGYTRGGRSWKL